MITSIQTSTAFTAFPREAIEQSITARFKEQVERHGGQVAVSTPGGSWSFAELDARSNAIASAIVQRLGGSSAPIALLMDQGAALVEATMGVLKARKFYVPLEPWHPIERCREMLAFSGARAVITVSAYAGMARRLAGQGVDVLDIDTLSRETDDPGPGLPIDARDPAYLFFTSGSTGKPKGVVDSHRNVLHNIMRYTNALRVAPDDRLTLIQSASFSGTVSSLFTALLNGATVLPFDLRNEGFVRLAEWIQRSRATIYHSVPSIFRGVVEAGGHFPSVRVVRLEGDGATRVDVDLFRSAFSEGCVLAHGLGATETGLSCQYRLTHDTPPEGVSVPIGFPLPDMQVSIVDDGGVQLPPGAVGEIEVRSAFLATGYWKDPVLTSERFIPTGDPHERRYRTGDLGRMDAEGCFHHLGRKDLEHKINGQFVDTKEVERALRRTGSFNDVVVITRRDDPADARLVAYVVPKATGGDEDLWRRDLSAVLPMQLIPSAFVALEALPVSEHGKLDRMALPPPPQVGARSGGPPVTEDEAQLAALWEAVLNVPSIGRKDNFFQLGGDSLRAALVVARIERLTGRVLPATALLEAPTVEELAQVMRDAQRSVDGTGLLLTLQARGPKPPFFFVDWPTGSGWQYAILAQKLGGDRPFHCILSGAIPDPWPAGTTIEHMAEATVRLIRRVQPQGPVRLGGNCYGGIIAFEAARQMRVAGDPVASLSLVAVSPRDFMGLVPRKALRRYWRAERRLRRAKQWKELREAGSMEGVAFIARAILNKTQYLAWRGAHAWRRVMGGPAPNDMRTYGAALLAEEAYRPSPLEGEVVLFLSEEGVKAYTDRPSSVWGGLARRVTIEMLPGPGEGFYSGPVLTELAGRLGRAIDGAGDPV